MIKTICLLALIFSVFCDKAFSPEQSVRVCSDLANGFTQFKTFYNKTYKDSQEEQDAQEAYNQCCTTILSKAPEESHAYSSSLHPQCDVSLSAITSSKLYFPPGKGTKFVDSSNGMKILGGCPPNHKTLSTTPKNQGSCGACWSFATTAAIESHINRVQNQVLDLSEEYVLECTTSYNPSATPASTCAGGIVDYALQMLVNRGLPAESTYPYQASSYGTAAGTPSSIGSCSSTSGFHKLSFPSNQSHALWYRYDDMTPSQIQTLLNRGSLVVAIYAEANLYSYSSGVFVCPVNSTFAKANINHAVEMVGMDCSGNYIIKNSWGTGWGEGGYATIDPNNDCGISAYVYSILSGVYLDKSAVLLLLGVLVTMLF